MGNKSLSFISAKVYRNITNQNPGVSLLKNALTIERDESGVVTFELTYRSSDLYVIDGPNVSLSRYFDKIKEICQQRRIDKVNSTPFGFEDEGELLLYWMRNQNTIRDLKIYHTDELDFADLREQHQNSQSRK